MRKLRYQLIGILLLVTLLPALPAAWTVRELVQRSFIGGAEEEILKGARAGLDAARDLLELEKGRFARRLRERAEVDTLSAAEIERLVPPQRRALERVPVAAGEPEESLLEAGPERIHLQGQELLVARLRLQDGSRVWVAQPLPAELVQRARSLAESVRLVETLRRDREELVRGLVFTFLAVYGLLLALVVALGLLVGSRLTRPLRQLGEGIDRVAGGDLETRVDTASAGHLSRLLGQFNRMTERLRAQQQELGRLERLAAWRNLARRLAHEIKNPLTPIQLAAQQMRDAYPGDDPEFRRLLDDGVEIVEEEVRSLRTLVQEFSAFARLPRPRMRRTSVREILDNLTGLFGPDPLRCVLPEGTADLTVWCDPDQIHRALINLVANARHAQEEAGCSDPVEVTAYPRTNGFVAVEVLDRGRGVAPEDRRRIFAPDYSTKSEGMGLGLAIVEGIVHAHGGSVEVAEREGGGAVFRLTLPARSRAASDETAVETGPSPRRGERA
jgi:nitrogen fixation/metabolism regulation signal transduction histidine kinase